MMQINNLLGLWIIAISFALVGYHVQQCEGQQMVTSQQGRGGNNGGANGDAGGQTLVISQNANGGIRVLDRTNNRELVNTNNLQLTEDNEAGDNNGLVAGLLEWIEEKKRKKKEKKDKERQPIILPYPVPQPQPMPMPLPPLPLPPLPMPLPPPPPPHRHERKEIHIHINNHIKKERHKEPHKKPHGYEDYHDGHGEHDHHDKYYRGKHSFPLLGHHLALGHYDHSSGDYEHHGADDYSGYESRGVAQYADSEGQQQRQQQQGKVAMSSTKG